MSMVLTIFFLSFIIFTMFQAVRCYAADATTASSIRLFFLFVWFIEPEISMF